MTHTASPPSSVGKTRGSWVRRLNILLLCDFNARTAGTIVDHIRALEQYSEHKVCVYPMKGSLNRNIHLDRFDALIIHYSLVACHDNYLSPETRHRIRMFKGLKAAFVQDDYRFIDRTVTALRYLRINALFPLPSPGIMEAVYPSAKLPGVRKTTVLAGYVPGHLLQRPVPSFEERPYDVCYRARKLPAWMGAHTLQKWKIAERFKEDAKQYGLICDISCREEDRIYAEDWIKYLSNTKAVLGTESGASVCDFTGKIQEDVERHVQHDPNASFEVLRDLYFKDVDGKILMNVISPRCFEAAALRTLMILYEGHYSGVFKPWRHYVPLKEDHSNMDEVVRTLGDHALAKEIIKRAYEEVALNENYSYRGMVKTVDAVIGEEFLPSMLAKRRPYTDSELSAAVRKVQRERRMSDFSTSFFLWAYPFAMAFGRMVIPPRYRPSVKNWVKALYFAIRKLPSNLRKCLRTLKLCLRTLKLFANPGKALLFSRILAGGRVKLPLLSRLLSDAVELANFQTYSRRVHAAQVLIVWDPVSGHLDIVSEISDADPGLIGPQMKADELVRIFCEGLVAHVRWVQEDASGLGPAGESPLGAEYTFPALTEVGRVYPREVSALLLDPSRKQAWFRSVRKREGIAAKQQSGTANANVVKASISGR